MSATMRLLQPSAVIILVLLAAAEAQTMGAYQAAEVLLLLMA